MPEPSYTGAVECGHCGNTGAMAILREQNEIKTHEWEERHGSFVINAQSDRGYVYRLLKCAACEGMLLDRVGYDDGVPEDVEMLYPAPLHLPDWLPGSVAAEYRSALKERHRNPNGFATLLGRVLDSVCDDKAVPRTGGRLKQRLEKLVEDHGMQAIQEGVSGLRNVGAHSDAGNLTKADVRLLESLTQYVLDHIYLAPKLNADARQAEQERRSEQRECAQ